jgi:pilus assembly protein CpaB
MNRRLLTILSIAFLCAGACSLLVYRLVGNRVTSAHKQTTVRVVAASSDTKLGTVLSSANLTTVEIAGSLPKGAILKPEDAIGRGVISDLYQGEPILESRLASPGSGGGLAATIRKGMRACAVKVDEVVGVAGFVTPGMRVDVLISGDPPGPINPVDGPEVRTLLQNIEVLSAGTDIQKNTEGKPHPVQVVNLLVDPEQAEVLSLASAHTHIQLVLRNPLDTQTGKLPGTALSSLFGQTGKAPVKARAVGLEGRPQKPASLLYSVVVFNGSQRSEQKFESHEEKQ